MLSPLLKLDIAWKAECLDGDSLCPDGKDDFSVSGRGSVADFIFFKVMPERVRAWGATWTGIGRMTFDDAATFPCPRFGFSNWLTTGTGTAAGPTDTGKAGITGSTLKLQVSTDGGGGNGCGCEAVSWWCPSTWSSIGVAVTWLIHAIGKTVMKSLVLNFLWLVVEKM